MNKSIPSKPPLPKNPEYDVVWSGSTVSAWGERGSLLPPTHHVGSTWRHSVERLKQHINAVNKRHIDG